MSKVKELSHKLRDEIMSPFFTLHHKGTGCKKTSKTLQIPRDIVNNIIRGLKIHGIAANCPGHGRRRRSFPHCVVFHICYNGICKCQPVFKNAVAKALMWSVL